MNNKEYLDINAKIPEEYDITRIGKKINIIEKIMIFYFLITITKITIKIIVFLTEMIGINNMLN